MSGLESTNIIVGVTGSIAAYKAAVLARDLISSGSNLRVVMTESASHFISPLTFASLSRHSVALDMYPPAGVEPASGSWHIDWALWADAMVIAPASAATIARLAAGLSDNALTVIATALRGKLFVAPAMDHDMYRYPALERNLRTLESFGIEIIPATEGELASGLVGIGRMAEPERIVETLGRHFSRTQSLASLHVVVTAGPTHEPVDPVRYIANRSSGRMGYAIAEEAAARGARVTLISGPTSIDAPRGVVTNKVSTAEQMADAAESAASDADIVIAAAAVSDFTPSEFSEQKLKRRSMDEAAMHIELRPTRDILRSIGQSKRPGQIVVGFALETEDLVESARRKLREKNCDMVVANPASEPGIGMGADMNRVTLVLAESQRELPVMTKRDCARAILDAIEGLRPQSAGVDARRAVSVGDDHEQ